MAGIARATMLNRVTVADEGVMQWYPGRRWGTGADEGIAQCPERRWGTGLQERGGRGATMGTHPGLQERGRRGATARYPKKEEEEGRRWGTRDRKKEEEDRTVRKKRKRADEAADAMDHEEAVEGVWAGDPDAIDEDLDVGGVGCRPGAKRDGGGRDSEATAGAGGLKLGAGGELREIGKREEAGMRCSRKRRREKQEG